MDEQTFAQTVTLLEQQSAKAPQAYRIKVALLAALGFAILAAVVATAGFGILLLAGIAIAAVATGGQALLLILKFGKLLVLLIIPLWLLVKSSLVALFTRFPSPSGREIQRRDAPQLFAAMDRMQQRLRGPRCHHVLITDEMNAAVVQRPLLGLVGWPRNYLVLGLPLLESLSPDEALAVVAHEYGHLAGSHGRFGAWIYRLRHTWGTIQQLASGWEGIGGRLLRRIVEWYAPYFNAYTFVLARANEYEADAASADLVGAATAASALKRVNIAAARHAAFFDDVFKGTRDLPAPPRDIALRWSKLAGVTPDHGLAARLLAASLQREKSAFDSHPVLRDRLCALPGEADRVDVPPAPLPAATAADTWLGTQAGLLREAMQQQWASDVAPHWEAQHTALQQRIARLAELRGLATPDAGDDMERLELQALLEPERDSLPEVMDINQRPPQQPRMLLLEGRLRLDRDDAAGLLALDRAMQADPEATKAACELAHHWLSRRGERDLARKYAEQWQARDEFEQRRSHELDQLDTAHELRAPDLDPQELQRVRDLIAANPKGVARAWIARRVLPSDPAVPTYVLVIEPRWWNRTGTRSANLLSRLATVEWPMHAFLVTCTGTHRKLRARVASLPQSQIFGGS